MRDDVLKDDLELILEKFEQENGDKPVGKEGVVWLCERGFAFCEIVTGKST